ncbi:unnamed protein product [Didymodactylos carnosus]|uniref:Uncharacterized protein n=1 Tax=Didymodactylos carnosus TaxID=1234261 RepID=A0A813U5S1_9BILA|nr:unnamed protein product [Didymodactylos carnosus]CAF0818749.1 unnamed protein product [Didymodactylos carnosus]CAF3567566.1 unnamed protein product [Didymodactylos carnosus]CAF3605034.1 unnamed protein product [Didymodactylos carnosus]
MGSETACSLIGGGLIVLLIAGYFGQQFLPPPKPKIIGLDLGTTYSCVGIYHAISGVIEVIPAQRNRSCMPSIVSFLSDTDIRIGYDANDLIETNSKYTIYDTKRFIGKKYTKENLDKIQKNYPFELVLNSDGYVEFVISSNGTTVSAQKIGSIILRHLKTLVEQRLNIKKMYECVLSVPAEFDKEQIDATVLAAELAQLSVRRTISEPTAAALAYGLHKKSNIQYILVIDIGGGTTDISLLHVQGGMFKAQAMAGNNRLGGQDFNQNTVNFVMNEMNLNKATLDPNVLQHLRTEIERCKLEFSSQTSCLINSSFTLSRETFETINKNLFKKIVEPLDRIFEYVGEDSENNGLKPKDIDEIVLVGGSTRMLKIRQLIEEYFNKKPNTNIDPDVAVTYGVAIQAGILGGMWPLSVGVIEVKTAVEKIHIEP